MSYNSPNPTGQLLEVLAGLSARASENEHQVQALLAVVVRAATTRVASEEASDNNDDAHNDFLNNILLDEIQKLWQSSSDFNAECEAILEGMREAILAHDNRGAANAFFRYQRCRARPRPLLPARE